MLIPANPADPSSIIAQATGIINNMIKKVRQAIENDEFVTYKKNFLTRYFASKN